MQTLEELIESRERNAIACYWRAYYQEDDTQGKEEAIWYWRELSTYLNSDVCDRSYDYTRE